jgi:hypothetical protein
MSYCVVTAYYPLQTSKHSLEKYHEWIQNFFSCVTCDVFVFCPDEIYQKYKDVVSKNTKFIVRPFDSFEMMSPKFMDIWKEFHKIDPENSYHNPYLYAIWAAKQEFVREAMANSNYDTYVWCDIGCFRNRRPGSFVNVNRYVVDDKITCLYLPRYKMIGGGVLAGSKNAWNTFSNLYKNALLENPHGSDQIIYKRILNDTNALIFIPSFLPFVPDYDEWFFLTYIFSYNLNSN